MASDPISTTVNPTPVQVATAKPAVSRVGVLLAFFSIYFIWGSTYLAIRYAVTTIPPLYTAGVRHLTAGLILMIWAAIKRLRPTAAQLRASVVIGALFFLIGHGSLHWAEQKVPSGLAALLIAIEPIFVFLLSEWADRKWQWNAPLAAGIVLGLAGVAVLMRGSFAGSGPGVLTSGIAILIGAFSWALGIVYSRRSQLSGHPLLLSALSLLSGSVLLLIAGTIAGEYRGFTISSVAPRSWIALVYLILFGSVIAFTAYNWLLEHYSATLVATHTYVNPIVAVLLGWLFAGEKITVTIGISTCMVIGAVILVDRGTARLSRV
jgi:drug/metabolite transporter (DMT)-like permease